MDLTPAERLATGYEMDPDSMCWVWTKAINRNGYGVTWNGERTILAHRYSYEVHVGPIPEDRPHLDHLCSIRACINPEHLEPVTQAENNRRVYERGSR